MYHRAILSVLAALTLGAVNAQAHAHLQTADPSAGSTIRAVPERVLLTFSERIEPSFSTIEVRNTAGNRVDQGNAMVSGNQLSVGLGPLPPGTYRVDWRVLSVDTHKTHGSFSFRLSN
jgi:methionine-rich copper-binding protein CopC